MTETASPPLRRSLAPLACRADAVTPEGVFAGYAAVFDAVDQTGDTIPPGAFARSLAEWSARGRLPPMLWSHQPNAMPIGVWTAMREDARGLWVEGQLALNSSAGRDAHALLRLGAVTGLSIGYRARRAERDPTTGAGRLEEIELVEVSLVNRPADDAARVTFVKSHPEPSQEHRDMSELSEFDQRLAAVETKAAAAGRLAEQTAAALRAAPRPPAELRADPRRVLGRMVIALAEAKGDVQTAARLAGGWGDAVLSKALSASIGPAGGFAVPVELAEELIALLRPVSVVRALGARSVPMPRGAMTIPAAAVGTAAGYVGEQQPLRERAPTFRAVALTARKLGALVAVSNDMLRYATAAAEAFVADDLVAAIAAVSDGAFLRGDGTGAAPTGLRFRAPAAQVLAATTPVTLASVTRDLARLELALLEGDVPMTRPGWVMAPRTELYLKSLRDSSGAIAFPEMSDGELRGYPYRRTTLIPVDLGGGAQSEIILADFDHVVIGDATDVRVERFDGAAYVDGAGALQSALSRDETVMRAITAHDLALRHDRAVAVLTGVTWTP